MKLNALEIIFQDDVQSIFNTFSQCFNVRVLFYSPDGGEILTGHACASNCSYCSLLQDQLFGVEKCEALDERMRREALEKKEQVVYICHAGLLEAVMPIMAGRTLCGYAMVGQIRCNAAMPEQIEREWAARHAAGPLRVALEQLPIIEQSRVRDMLELFTIIVRYIISQNMITLRGNLMLEDALAYMRKNLARKISLRDLTTHTHRSASTISHLFQERLGKTFRRTMIEMRLEKAEEILSTTPGITIAETAQMVGYDDPFRFSTLYRKYRGFPPSQYARRQSLAATHPLDK